MSNAKTLTEDQIAQVRSWADEGSGISEIQKKLSEEFGVRVTYLETRFLLEDWKIEIRIPAKPEPEKPEEEVENIETDEDSDDLPDSTAPGVKVKLSVDQVLRPGALVSGKAIFSGGQSASWWIDQMGRLGLDAVDPQFRPSEEESIAFQNELRAILRKSGF